MPKYNALYEQEDFYPRPPRGGRRKVGQENILVIGISIHVLREEDDNSSRTYTAHAP